jgi:hypothetical protein
MFHRVQLVDHHSRSKFMPCTTYCFFFSLVGTGEAPSFLGRPGPRVFISVELISVPLPSGGGSIGSVMVVTTNEPSSPSGFLILILVRVAESEQRLYDRFLSKCHHLL